jgi:uncharacterized protein (TIGR02145 family)
MDLLKINLYQMKYFTKVSVIILSILFINGCKKEKPIVPVVTTNNVTEISYTTATSGGEATNDGGAPVLSKGVCWGISANPTISANLTTESGGLGSFTSHLAMLTANTLYYVRAFATNSAGTGYGDQVTFTTSQIAVPALTTTELTAITKVAAVSGGNITSENGASVTERGVCWSTSANPTIADNKTTEGTGTGSFSSALAGLSGGTTYYVRAFATNSGGTGYGNEISFTTLPPTAPVLTTKAISSLTTNSLISGGAITDDGGASITARGICWNTASNPTIGNNKSIEDSGTGNFTSSIFGLLPNTTYYIRAYATNNAGTAYGNEQMILTYAVADMEGNFYHAVTIGTQTWLQENLNVTKFNNGDPIVTTIPADKDISAETSPVYQWAFEGNEVKAITYGRLYTWYVATDNRKICPAGWHVSTDSEWTIMETWLNANGYNYDGTTTFDLYNKLAKALASATLWSASGTPGAPGNIDFPEYRNKSGFTALPGSQRGNDGGFGMLEVDGSWWTSSEIQNNIAFAWARQINRSAPNENRVGSTKDTGMSVRCVKD